MSPKENHDRYQPPQTCEFCDAPVIWARNSAGQWQCNNAVTDDSFVGDPNTINPRHSCVQGRRELAKRHELKKAADAHAKQAITKYRQDSGYLA